MEKIDITVVKRQVENYLTDTMQGRSLSERDRDYYDHKQWTAQEEAKLRARNQAPIIVNRVKPKVEGLIGLYNMRKVDPKAYARTKKHQQASHAITDALRYVADSTDLNTVKMECANDFWVEGTCGAIVEVKQKKNGDIDINVSRIPWDRLYYDTHSRNLDFSDGRFKGMILWLDEDQIAELFPKAKLEDLSNTSDYSDETFEDRPRWQDRLRNRIRVAYHFFIHKGVWHYCIFSGNTYIVEPQESPFLDDDGEPTCIIELVSANIDRDNNRYGEVRSYISQQDEINHRRSKALHLLSQRQTISRNNAIQDVPALKRELAKPDGHVQIFGKDSDFEVLPTGDMAQGQFELYQDAKAELDAVGMNAQLSGERQQGDLSGRAIERLQQAGTMELNRQYQLLTGWEKRIYRQIWSRVKQFWTEEKWVRVTDDQNNLRWVGLNSQITAQEWLEEQINDDSLPKQQRRQAAASYKFLMQAAEGPAPELVEAAQAGDQNAMAQVQQALQMQPMAQEKLDELVAVKNPVPELDVDIILEQSFDIINAQQEQFEMLAKFAQGSDVDILDLIELSDIRGKEALIEKIEKRRQQMAEAQGDMAKIQSEQAQAKTAETLSKTKMNEQKAIQTNIENTLLVTDPQRVSSVAV